MTIDRYGFALGASLITARDIRQGLKEEADRASVLDKPGLERAADLVGESVEILTSLLANHSGQEAISRVEQVLSE